MHKKLISGQKQRFWAHIRQSVPKNGPPNGHLPENQMDQELPQGMGDLWSNWVGPLWLKKDGGFIGCSVKKCRISGHIEKCSFMAQNPFFSEMVQICCNYHDWTPNRQHFCVDPVARRALGQLPGPIFCPKFCPFLALHLWNPHFFGLGRALLNGIISPPYPEKTLDNFGFPVVGGPDFGPNC